MRLENRIAIIFGAGQTPGETVGNGRATALTFAREGAKVMAVDRNLASAEETAALIAEKGGEATAVAADVTDESAIEAAVAACMDRWGRIDILHNNVGVSIEGGDAPITEITVEAFDRVVAINLRGMVLACKHTLPIMREQESGVIINISSMAARSIYPLVGYKTTKTALLGLTEQLAIENAKYGIRANCILPGLMDTPMGVDVRARTTGRSRAQIEAERNAYVPLGGRQGTGWDVANAALFLASDEAGYITGVILPVDGGVGVNTASGSKAT